MLVSATDDTPGTVAIFSISACWRRTTAAGSLTVSGMDRRNVCSDSGWVKPGSTCRSALNVRIINPAPTSRTSASATCRTTSVLRARCRSRLSVRLRPAARSVSATRGPGVLERRNQAERHAGGDRDERGEGERPAVERDLIHAREIRRRERDEHAEPAPRQGEARDAAEDAERRALDQQFAHELGPAGAERRADRQLVLPAVGPHQQQVGDVRARDEQHQADRAHQHPQHRRDLSDHASA